MIKVFKLPDLGEGLTESEIVAWHIAPGDTVTLNQHIADVETAKAVVELPSPFAGTVAALHQPTGVVVQVGEAIVSFDVEGVEPAAAAPTAPSPGASGSGVSGSGVSAPAEPAQEREAVLVGYGASVERGGRPQRRARRGAAAPTGATSPAPVVLETPAAPDATAAPATTTGERPRSTPPVRALARDLGVDLASLTGTGPGGLITRDDVRSGVATGTSPDATALAPAAASVAGARETRTPIKSVRKYTAAAMVRSAFTAPHVTEFLTIDVTPTVELLDSLKRNRAFADQRINILTVVAKALCIAASRHPSVNTRWDDEAGEIVQYNYVNLGIAAATPRGLLVPNIKDADALTLTGLSAALAGLTEAARAGSTSPAALGGGTITITNIGVFGIDAGTPILNPGEAAILAMGAIRRTPWEYKGEIALRQVMTLSLSFDHRLVDGEQGSRFLADIGAILAEPGMVLTMV